MRKLKKFSPPPARAPKKVVLIVCEGEKTEQDYFQPFREKYRAELEIKTVAGKDKGHKIGTNPLNIVEFAKKEHLAGEKAKKRANKKSADLLDDIVIYDSIWCVFDKDDHEQEVIDAHREAEKHKIKIAFSNPAFEVWLLYHFQLQTAPLTKDELWKALKKYLPNYDKSLTTINAQLLKNSNVACKNARKGRERNKKDPATRAQPIADWNPELANPCSTVDLLVDELEQLAKPSSKK
jgi:hypothetical protein